VIFRMSLPDGHYEYVSPAAIEILGLTPDELYESPERFRECIHPEWLEYFEKHWRRLLDGKAPPFYEYQYVHKNGSVKWLHQRNTVIKDDLGRLVAIEGIVTDISERKRMEAALHESESRYRIVSELTSDYAYAFRIEPNGDLVNEWVTGALVRITGYTAPELTERGGWETLIYREDLPIALHQLEELLAGNANTVEYRVVDKNGTLRWMSDTARPHHSPDGSRITHIFGAVKDISGRKRAEEQRRNLEAQIQQAQKLESLGVLAGGIAHDFNNLLMGILGNADLTLMNLDPESPMHSTVQDIHTTAVRASELVRQMLAYAGKGRFVVERLDLGEIVKETTQLLEVSISKKATLKYDYGENVPLIEGDATQLRQILMNLITNASDALEDKNGVITVRTGVRECDRAFLRQTYLDDGLPAGTYAFAEVSDDGKGMDAETRLRVFDPFFTTKFVGRGLGLAAVLGIVRSHRGAIDIRSEPGVGTTFRVLFAQAAEASEPVVSDSTAPCTYRGSGQILLVDDEASVRTVGRQMAETLGFQVTTANDGAEALEIFAQDPERFRCVILDLTMPILDGEECLRELRKISAEACVLLSTGFDKREILARFEVDRVTGFIQKPYTVEILAEKLHGFLVERE